MPNPRGVELALLPSPLLGPSTWRPVAEELERLGWPAAICAASDAASTPQEVRRSLLGTLPADRDLVLVPHSNAGLYVPGIITERSVRATVFVDAALPPEEGTTALVPAGLYEFLERHADEDGLLPRWTQWWDSADIDRLFPGPAVRRLVEAEQRRLPLAYFAASLQTAAGWVRTPCSYIAFGDTYADERRRAEQYGWPVTTLAGRHLHALIEPRAVATAITDMLASTHPPVTTAAP